MSSLLCDWEIENAILSNELIIKPFNKALISSNSVDLRLGDQFLTYLKSDKIIDPYDAISIGQDIKETLYAKTFIIRWCKKTPAFRLGMNCALLHS